MKFRLSLVGILTSLMIIVPVAQASNTFETAVASFEAAYTDAVSNGASALQTAGLQKVIKHMKRMDPYIYNDTMQCKYKRKTNNLVIAAKTIDIMCSQSNCATLNLLNDAKDDLYAFSDVMFGTSASSIRDVVRGIRLYRLLNLVCL